MWRRCGRSSAPCAPADRPRPAQIVPAGGHWTPAVPFRYNNRVKTLRLLLCGLLVSAAACAPLKKGWIPSGDMIELPSARAALAPEEQQNLLDGGIQNLVLPMGILGEDVRPEIPNPLQLSIVAKFIVPPDKQRLLGDGSFRRRLFKTLEDLIVKTGAAQTQVSAVLLHFEGPKPPEGLDGLPELRAGLRPLKISLGTGVPLFWATPKLENALDGADFVVLFEQGYAYPPSLNPSLIDSYRGQSKENRPTGVTLPHFRAFSLISTAWVTRAGGGMEVWPGVNLDDLVEGAGISFSGPIVESYLVDPQYAFEVRRDHPIGRWQAGAGDKVTLAFVNYPFRRDTLGEMARHQENGLLGRYLGLYVPDTENGIIGYNAFKDYLSGVTDGPAPRAELVPSGGGYVIQLTNMSGMSSDLSASGNYVEWITSQGRVRDASAGEFQRFRFMEGEQEEIPDQATAVRFYEPCLGPYETVRTGPVYFSGAPSGTLWVMLTLPGGEVLRFRFPVG